MSGFSVKQPGLLSLLQDRGRYGAHRLGLTTGGPLDHLAFDWANRLIGNDANATCVEISFGGLSLEAETETSFVITGAQAPCKLNGEAITLWETLDIRPSPLRAHAATWQCAVDSISRPVLAAVRRCYVKKSAASMATNCRPVIICPVALTKPASITGWRKKTGQCMATAPGYES
jgi:hypothetical protein